MNCLLCDRVKLTHAGTYPYLIHEFKHSFLFLGEHQYYAGYSVLVLKDHYREMTDLPEAVAQEVFSEMMLASKAIDRAFSPKKMNLCSLGNVVEHIHWHFFPRYADDPQFTNPPWLQMQHFDGAKVTSAEAQAAIRKIKAFL